MLKHFFIKKGFNLVLDLEVIIKMNEALKAEKKKGLGTVLKLLRIANDLSIKEMAQKLEVSSAYISEVEANNKKPSLDLISKYSEVLNVNKSTIMYFDEEGSKYEYSYQKLLLAILEKITKTQ